MNGSAGIVSVIGGSNLDIVGSPANALIRSDSNIGTVKLSPGGVGRNIAENAALLGINTRLFSVVGDDSFGAFLLNEAIKSGINVDWVKRSSLPTGIYLAILDENMDMDLAINSMKIMDELNQEYLSAMKDTIDESELVVFDANLNKEVLKYGVDLFKHKKLFLDTVSTAKTIAAVDVIGSFHTIKPNRIEAEALTGISINSIEDMKMAVHLLHSKGVKNICITLGKDGVFFSSIEGSQGRFKTDKFIPVNATGAGDAFQAGLIYGELNGMKLSDSVRYAMGASILAMSSSETINKGMSIEVVESIANRLEEK